MPEKNLKLQTKQSLRSDDLKDSKLGKPSVKKVVSKRPKASGFSVPVYSLDGKETGTLDLPKELFGVKINKPLLAQALRVYANNLKGHFSHTKTRSEVKGSTRKVRVQKGTGGARHGSVRAPIFVGGGIALGPKFRKVMLDLPKKMRKAALLSALSSKFSGGEIIGVSGLEKASGKTVQMKKFLDKVGKKNALFVLDEKRENASRAVRNLPAVQAFTAGQVNILGIIKHQTLILTKEAVEKLELRMKSQELREEGEK